MQCSANEKEEERERTEVEVVAITFLFGGFIWELQVNSITHQLSLAAGLGIIVYAGLANPDDWKEFYQYFRESKFVSVVNSDFYNCLCRSMIFQECFITFQ